MLAVVGALFANALVAILKLVAAFITGSSGMMAEALHSVADTANQIFCSWDCVSSDVRLLRSTLSATEKSASSGLSLLRSSFSGLAQPTRFTKV